MKDISQILARRASLLFGVIIVVAIRMMYNYAISQGILLLLFISSTCIAFFVLQNSRAVA